MNYDPYEYEQFEEDMDSELQHYGMPRRSGRYPWGSGENPYQHSGDFLSRVNELKSQGKTDTEIAHELGLSTTDYRIQKKLAEDDRKRGDITKAKNLREKGYSYQYIANELGYNSESSIRNLLSENSPVTKNRAQNTADQLKGLIESKGMLDVGAGAEYDMNVSRTTLDQAIYILEQEGYPVYNRGVQQVTNPGKQTIISVICPKGTEYEQVYDDAEVHSVGDYVASTDGGETWNTMKYPASMDSSRLGIRYADEGGNANDGLVEIRRGVDDLYLGDGINYAQVRILVDGTHYIKGMAVYSDDLPDGVDVMFNTNKGSDKSKMEVLKEIKTDDPVNPFGSAIKAKGQSTYTDADGNEQLSLINKRAEEGDWDNWSSKIPSQFLSKQPMQLINRQLDLSIANSEAEYDEICSLTNGTIKKKLLYDFAEGCDSAAVHLQAAALPRQSYQVIIPVDSLKDTEVYAPNYKPGEKVALIRYPHGGTFEIPILTVNNKQADAIARLGTDPKDAVAINKKVADRLSGADFDGDTVMVIPVNNKVKILSTPPLKDLEGFDAKVEYGTTKSGDDYINSAGKAIKVMGKQQTQNEMGRISNLITDMTLKGATDDELARAVKHSMVVIDANKHKLDYKQSEADNAISSLKKRYQGYIDEDGNEKGGASTLISRAKSETRILKTKGTPKINPETGELEYKTVTETYVDKNGKTQTRTQTSTQMADTKDARTLISSMNTQAEQAYARYANSMKALANKARKTYLTTEEISRDSNAEKVYATEVASLNSKLTEAKKNAPRERQAQLRANAEVKAKAQDNPDMTKEDKKKASSQALARARVSVGAKRSPIDITDKEWEAIQAGAISKSKLSEILKYADSDKLKERAMPRNSNSQLSTAKQNRIKRMINSGYSIADVAEAMNISTSTVRKYM